MKYARSEISWWVGTKRLVLGLRVLTRFLTGLAVFSVTIYLLV
jgi:hypothetical protein